MPAALHWPPVLVLMVITISEPIAAHGSGAWRDPKHADLEDSMKGMRYVAETGHKLSMVGTDDGINWWSIVGHCTSPEGGVPMSLVHFDFSPKGGPADLTAQWTKDPETGDVTLSWPDGNVWELLAPTFDSELVEPKLLDVDGADAMLDMDMSDAGLSEIKLSEAEAPADSSGFSFSALSLLVVSGAGLTWGGYVLMRKYKARTSYDGV